MRRVAAIVTDKGGRTAHAAIVSREFGLPCIVGTDDATSRLHDGDEVTVCCAEGAEGHVYAGRLPFAVERIDASTVPSTRTQVMLIVGDPSRAFSLSAIPNAGVGLARTEFIVTNHIGIHPMALARYPHLKDPQAVKEIAARIGAETAPDFFVQRFSEGVARIAAAFYPKPVIVRTSDFKTNEYAQLLGGREFEPDEENPMIGFRGASRYDDPRYAEGFALECAALLRARRDLGLTNIKVMIPFCRTVEEGQRVLAAMAAPWPASGRGRARDLRDVRDAVERRAGRGVPASLRRLLHRLERPDAADARPRPRLRNRRAPVRRAQRRGALVDRARHCRRQAARKADRHLRPGAVGLSGVRRVAGRGRASTRSRSTRMWPSRRPFVSPRPKPVSRVDRSIRRKRIPCCSANAVSGR